MIENLRVWKTIKAPLEKGYLEIQLCSSEGNVLRFYQLSGEISEQGRRKICNTIKERMAREGVEEFYICHTLN